MQFRYERKQLKSDLVLWETFGTPTPSEWQGCLDAVAAWLTEAECRGQRLRLIVDSNRMPVVHPQIRTLFAEWRGRHAALIANSIVAAVYVAEEPILRGVLTAVFWISPPVVPVEITSSRELALTWLGENPELLTGGRQPQLDGSESPARPV